MFRLGCILSALILITSFVSGCKKKEDCGFIAPQLVYVGFTEPETDTIIIRRFTKGTNFTQLLDTTLVTKAFINRTILGQDTVALSPSNYTKVNYEFYAHDWEVMVPGAAHTDRFYDIEPRFVQESEASAQCQSFVKTMKANGQVFNYETWFGGGYKYYITH